MNESFSESEARHQVGLTVKTVIELPDVPMGTRGTVVSVHPSGSHGWTVDVQWDLPPRRTEIFAQLFDFSFNLPWRSKRPLAHFSKSDLTRLLKPVDSKSEQSTRSQV